MQDRRFEIRHPAADPVELSWDGGMATGSLCDFSRSGARLETDRPVKVESKLRIAVRGLDLSARVVSCVKKSNRYIIGVELDPEFQGALKRKS